MDLCISFSVFVFSDELIEEARKKDVTEPMINSIYQDLAPIWKRLARELGINNARCAIIDNDEHKIEEKAFRLCMEWIQGNAGKATVGRFVDALVKIEEKLIANTFLVEVIFKSDTFWIEQFFQTTFSPLLPSPRLTVQNLSALQSIL